MVATIAATNLQLVSIARTKATADRLAPIIKHMLERLESQLVAYEATSYSGSCKDLSNVAALSLFNPSMLRLRLPPVPVGCLQPHVNITA